MSLLKTVYSHFLSVIYVTFSAGRISTDSISTTHDLWTTHVTSFAQTLRGTALAPVTVLITLKSERLNEGEIEAYKPQNSQ